jgi:hypothetical protein
LLAGEQYLWSVDGVNLFDEPLGGTPSGTFTTVGGSSGNTNAVTLFSIGKRHHYLQTTAGAPTLDLSLGYRFDALTTLSSNRTADAVTLTKPGGGSPVNLTRSPLQNYFFFLDHPAYTDLGQFEAAYPSGSYTFTVISNSSSQAVAVNLSAAMLQPNAPQVTNFAAAQAIDPAQPFRLGWNPFQGGTASDYIVVSIGDVFSTPDAGEANALRGTDTSVVIPAGTLQPGTTHTATIGFYRWTYDASNPSYHKGVYRSTWTDMEISTAGTPQPSLVLTNASIVEGKFTFEVDSPVGLQVMVEASASVSGTWVPLAFTNSPGRFLVVDPEPPTQVARFYRAQAL